MPIYRAHRFCKYDYVIYMGSSSLYYVQFGLMYAVVPVENRELILKAYYPFDYKSSPTYEIMIVTQILQGLVMCSIQALSESLLIALVRKMAMTIFQEKLF